MLVLFETSAGFALFKLLKDGRLDKPEDLYKDFESLDAAQKVVKLKSFCKFDTTTDALAAATAIVDSKMSKSLKKFLKKHADGDSLGVVDAKLGAVIKDKLGIQCVASGAVSELSRGIRAQLGGLVAGLAPESPSSSSSSDDALAPMALGLAHSLSRYKLKFSPDKVDTMVVQAIGLLDDLDKELNTYAMRAREWYGWHFPEMAKVVSDNVAYAKCVRLMGSRDNAAATDFSGIGAAVDEDVEARLKEAAAVSMGTEISETDLANVAALCDQVVSLSEYRAQLFDYLRARMSAIAPNLTALVGELVGARLVAHAGSLLSLAKAPASTVQILGAEKALFRALKTKHDTPKYGLIYHASLIGQAPPKLKGKISRLLAAKCSLGVRVDALGDGTDATVGLDARAKVEARLRQLEGRALATDGAKPRGKAQPTKYNASGNGAANGGGGGAHDAAGDATPAPSKKDKKEKKDKKDKKEKKEKKDKKKKREDDDDGGGDDDDEGEKKKKKKKKSKE